MNELLKIVTADNSALPFQESVKLLFKLNLSGTFVIFHNYNIFLYVWLNAVFVSIRGFN